GIEAFGRPADYSPIEDGIVRRRAVSLREKLQEVYTSDLADARIRIDLPKGRYVPRFVRVEPENSIEVLPSAVVPIEHVMEPAALPEPLGRPLLTPPPVKVFWFVAGAVLGALICAALFVVLRLQPWSTPQVSAAAPAAVAAPDSALAATPRVSPPEQGVV